MEAPKAGGEEAMARSIVFSGLNGDSARCEKIGSYESELFWPSHERLLKYPNRRNVKLPRKSLSWLNIGLICMDLYEILRT
jgi:hypothetical protein